MRWWTGREISRREALPLCGRACFCVVLVLGVWENDPTIALEPSLGLLFMPGGPKWKSSMKRLFTERHGGMKPRVSEELDELCRVGLLQLVEARISEEWFGLNFPFACSDGLGNAGTDIGKLKGKMAAYGVIRPDEWSCAGQNPADGQVFDLIEFSYEHIAEPIAGSNHPYLQHTHYSYNQRAGQTNF